MANSRAYFLEGPKGELKAIISEQEPKQEGWKVIRHRDLNERPEPHLVPTLQEYLRIGFGAGTGWGRNNFN